MKEDEMKEPIDCRRIDAPYEGSLEMRLHDFRARLHEFDPASPEEFVWLASHVLAEFAFQHVEDLDEVEADMTETLRRQFSQSG